MSGSPVYMRDLEKDKQTDAFFGKGTEELIKKAQRLDCNIVVGYYLEKPMLEE